MGGKKYRQSSVGIKRIMSPLDLLLFDEIWRYQEQQMTVDGLNLISSMNEERFHKLYHYGPVTCLKIHDNYIIAGYGPLLKVFHVDDLNQTMLIFNQQVFKRNKIHHISVDPVTGRMVISGAQSFMILQFNDLLQNESVKLLEKIVNEWIVTSYILDNDHVLLLNSHNTIIKVNIHDYTVEDKIDCNEKSILYSGSIARLPNGEIYITAGTVMSGIIIWNLNSREIKHTLTEHEGSIFGVEIDPTGKYITSCSDDRSIKLYNFEDGKLLATGWGHGSRIWNLSFFKPDNGLSHSKVKLVSCGEDCSLRVWEYIPGNECLVQVELWENFHRGKHIWSGDVDNLKLNVVVTGGADGKIRLHDLDSQSSEKYPLSTISKNIDTTFIKNESIRDYFEIQGNNTLVLLTSSGHLACRQNGSFSSIGHFPEFSDFGVVNGFSSLNTVIVGARSGDILIIDFNYDVPKLSWIKEVGGILNKSKVASMHFCSTSGKYFMLVDCPNPKVPFLLAEFEYKEETLMIANLTKIEKIDPKFPLTSFAIDTVNNWLILASRKVSIQVVDLKSMNISIFRKLSSGDTISSVSVTRVLDSFIHLLIITRDGTYTLAKINSFESGFNLDILQQNKVTRGSIEGGFMKDKELILYGFKSSYFFVWNETKQMEIMNENCGGSGHRNYKFYLGRQNDSFKFLYTNKDELCIRTHQIRFKDNFGLVQNGTHGREIRDLTISKDQKLVFTSSEDSSICISKLSNTGEMVNVWNMNNHMSGMQKIEFLNDNFIGSSAANEEFIIWKLTWANDIPMLAECSRLEPTKLVPDLRVMDFCSFKAGNRFILVTVYSDSTVKVWNWELESGFELIDSFSYGTCCILNCDFMELNQNKYLILGTTDGVVSFWDLTSVIDRQGSLRLALSKRLHQSGVKALKLVEDEGSYTLITGGDDNAITVSRITINDTLTLKMEMIDGRDDAASATITSISCIDSKIFITTSVDQVIRLWSFKKGKLECIGATYTSVADTGCSDAASIDGRNVVIIGGAGVSSWVVSCSE